MSRRKRKAPVRDVRKEWKRRLRGDRLANIALLAAAFAVVPSLLAWMGLLLPTHHTGGRANPVYWLMMLPLVVWVWSLNSFARWALGLLRPVLVFAPLTAALALLVAFRNHAAPIALWGGALGVSGIAGVAGWWAFGRSVIAEYVSSPV